jgi:peptidoglycan biosynthesis protein MviN/MurJ (putative lipid II flippase)
VLLIAFQRGVHRLISRDLLSAFARILAAAAAMAAAVWAASHWLETHLGAGLTAWSIKALGPVLIGAAVYFAAARVLRLEEARVLVGRFRR